MITKHLSIIIAYLFLLTGIYAQESSSQVVADPTVLQESQIDNQKEVEISLHRLPEQSENQVAEADSYTDPFGDEITEVQIEEPTLYELVKMAYKLPWAEQVNLLSFIAQVGTSKTKDAIISHLGKHKKEYIITLAGVGCAFAIVILHNCKKKR
jgi:hypothetical protein